MQSPRDDQKYSPPKSGSLSPKARLPDLLEFDYEEGQALYADFKAVLLNPGRGSSTRSEAEKIVKEIRARKLPFPLSRYFCTKDSVLESFENLKAYVPDWIERSHDKLTCHESPFWTPSLFRGQGCQLVVRKNDWWSIDVMIDYFIEYERIRAKKEYSPSLFDSWQDDSCLTDAVVQAGKNIDGQALRNAMFRVARELVPFRMSRSRALVQRVLSPIMIPFGADPNEDLVRAARSCSRRRWLDISAGWGDRLGAACSLDMDYFGFDPNLSLQKGHSEIIKTFGSKRSDQSTRQAVVPLPFESEESQKLIIKDVKDHGPYDICLTSPPFFIIERYNGPNQSTENYPEFEEWLIKFLFRSLFYAWQHLKDGGYLAINIANIRGCPMVEPTMLCIEEFFPGASWEGIITFSGRSTQSAPGILYVWQKRLTTPVSKWNPDIPRSLEKRHPTIYKNWRTVLEAIRRFHDSLF